MRTRIVLLKSLLNTYVLVDALSQGIVPFVFQIENTAADTLKTFTGLLKGKQYFWRVKTQSGAVVDLWSNVWRFITVAVPAKPQLREAAAIQDEPGYATYTWNKVQDADQYVIRVTARQTPNRIFRSASTSDTVRTFSGHSEGEQYTWQVQAGNIAGSGPWSDASGFTFPLIDVRGEAGTPTDYSIGQNYPNPFNPATTITFALPQAGQTTITLYDLLGRTVKTLINSGLKAGYHEIQVDAGSLPSAAYFYTIRSGAFVETKTMVVMK
jgi:hypothetical protein